MSFKSISSHVFFKFGKLNAHKLYRLVIKAEGDVRFENECEIEYKNDFFIPVCTLRIIKSQTHFIP